MVTTTVEVQRKTTSPLILDSPSNLIYHPFYVLDPRYRPRRQASLIHLCIRRMTPIQSTAGENKSRRQLLIRLGRLFRPKSPRSPLRYPTCPSPPCPPKIHIHLTQTPADQTALALPSTDTIAQVLMCYRLYLNKATSLANW